MPCFIPPRWLQSGASFYRILSVASVAPVRGTGFSPSQSSPAAWAVLHSAPVAPIRGVSLSYSLRCPGCSNPGRRYVVFSPLPRTLLSVASGSPPDDPVRGLVRCFIPPRLLRSGASFYGILSVASDAPISGTWFTPRGFSPGASAVLHSAPLAPFRGVFLSYSLRCLGCSSPWHLVHPRTIQSGGLCRAPLRPGCSNPGRLFYVFPPLPRMLQSVAPGSPPDDPVRGLAPRSIPPRMHQSGAFFYHIPSVASDAPVCGTGLAPRRSSPGARAVLHSAPDAPIRGVLFLTHFAVFGVCVCGALVFFLFFARPSPLLLPRSAVFGTLSRAAVRRMLCALPGFAAPGGRCALAPVRVPWLWPAACLSGVPCGSALVRRSSSGPVALGAPVGFPVAVVPSPTPGAVAPGFTGWLRGAGGGRPRTGLFVPAAGPCQGKGAGRAPRRTRSGPRDGVVPGGYVRLRSWAACAAVVRRVWTRSLTRPVYRTVRLATGDSASAPGLLRVDAHTAPFGSEDATPGSRACVRVRALPGRVGQAGLPGAFWCASPFLRPFLVRSLLVRPPMGWSCPVYGCFFFVFLFPFPPHRCAILLSWFACFPAPGALGLGVLFPPPSFFLPFFLPPPPCCPWRFLLSGFFGPLRPAPPPFFPPLFLLFPLFFSPVGAGLCVFGRHVRPRVPLWCCPWRCSVCAGWCCVVFAVGPGCPLLSPAGSWCRAWRWCCPCLAAWLAAVSFGVLCLGVPLPCVVFYSAVLSCGGVLSCSAVCLRRCLRLWFVSRRCASAVCVLGCRAVRSLSSSTCAVLCCAVLVPFRCAVRVVCAFSGGWCCWFLVSLPFVGGLLVALVARRCRLVVCVGFGARVWSNSRWASSLWCPAPLCCVPWRCAALWCCAVVPCLLLFFSLAGGAGFLLFPVGSRLRAGSGSFLFLCSGRAVLCWCACVVALCSVLSCPREAGWCFVLLPVVFVCLLLSLAVLCCLLVGPGGSWCRVSVACCAVSLGAVLRRVAKRCAAWRCVVVRCVVSLCSVWCCRALCCVLGRCPSSWGPVPSGAVFCLVTPRCVCLAVACCCVVLSAVVLCAVCALGCRVVRFLSSPPCAVLLCGPLSLGALLPCALPRSAVLPRGAVVSCLAALLGLFLAWLWLYLLEKPLQNFVNIFSFFFFFWLLKIK